MTVTTGGPSIPTGDVTQSGTPIWEPGTVYLPGAIVVPRSNNVVVNEQPYNNSFEDGLTQWTVTGEWCSNSAAQAATGATATESYDGAQSVTVTPFAGNGSGPTSPSGNPVAKVIITNQFLAPVKPGLTINFKCRFYHIFVSDTTQVDSYSGGCGIAWYNSSNSLISYSYASSTTNGSLSGSDNGMFAITDDAWVTISGSGVAPAGATHAAAVIFINTTSYTGQAWYADDYTWDYTQQGYPNGLDFVATQATQGTSGSTEPTWPTTSGQTVTDNTVTWTAEYASQITWTAQSILTSGATEPAWPTKIGAAVADNTVEWIATDGRITDSNCPQTTVVCIGAAKVYAADDDIIRYSATANAQDWSSSQDAGYIPFGLNNYGGENCAGLGLYRSNLVAFNSLGYQMWQIDPDPSNIAILDGEPVGCTYPRSIQPLNNDLVFLSPVGIRNIGTAGASGNLQAGQFGKQIDTLVASFVAEAAANGFEIRSLFNPGTGQYWLIFGTDVVVLTINGTSTMSWSRYEFPDSITDYTVLDGVLYLRAGDLVWEFSDEALQDDVPIETTGTVTMTTGYHNTGANLDYTGYVNSGYATLTGYPQLGSISGTLGAYTIAGFVQSYKPDHSSTLIQLAVMGAPTSLDFTIEFTDAFGNAQTLTQANAVSATAVTISSQSATVWEWSGSTFSTWLIEPPFGTASSTPFTFTTIVSQAGGATVPFYGRMSWNYIDGGLYGIDYQMEGFDLTIGPLDPEGQILNNDVVCYVSFGYNQSNREIATEPFAVTGDTIPGDLIPMPMVAPSFQLRLDFSYGQDWGWSAATLYMMPLVKR